MKIFTKAAWQPLRHPEFTFPGLLYLMIGAILAVPVWMIWRSGIELREMEFMSLSGLMILTGMALLLKSRIGTVLMVVLVIYGLYTSVASIGFSWSRVPRFLASLLFWASMIGCAVFQFQFHRSRGKQRLNEFVLPPLK